MAVDRPDWFAVMVARTDWAYRDEFAHGRVVTQTILLRTVALNEDPIYNSVRKG